MAPPYQDRADRFFLNASLWFTAEGKRVAGRSVDVSASGMRAVLGVPVEIWSVGELSIEVGQYLLYFQAKVARIEGLEVGLAFRVLTEGHRQSAEMLVELAAESNRGTPIG